MSVPSQQRSEQRGRPAPRLRRNGRHRCSRLILCAARFFLRCAVPPFVRSVFCAAGLPLRRLPAIAVCRMPCACVRLSSSCAAPRDCCASCLYLRLLARRSPRAAAARRCRLPPAVAPPVHTRRSLIRSLTHARPEAARSQTTLDSPRLCPAHALPFPSLLPPSNDKT
jgi:hypothetical protein